MILSQTAAPGDPGEPWWIRVGAIAAIILGVSYIVIVALYVPMGTPPHGAEARLQSIAGHPASWQAILWLSVLTDLLFLPLTISLYLVLRRYNGNAMILAGICSALFVVLDLAITWTNYAALIVLSQTYAQAADETGRLAAVAAARYPTVVVESNLLFFYNSLILSAGIFITGYVMRQGPFGKGASYLGLATGLCGLIAVVGPVFLPALGVAIVVTSILTTVWLLLIGFRLYVLGRRR